MLSRYAHVPCMDLMGWSLVREAIIRIAMTAQLGSIYPLTVSLELFEPICEIVSPTWQTQSGHSFRFPSSRNLQVMKWPLLPQPPGPLLSKEGPSNTRSQGLGINMVRGCLDGRFGSWGFIGTDPCFGWRFVFGGFGVCERQICEFGSMGPWYCCRLSYSYIEFTGRDTARERESSHAE